ncbi:hypothetical protein [Viscerimonas tarda]
MKKLLILFMLFVPLCCVIAQEEVEENFLVKIPVRDGKVVFTKTIALPAGIEKPVIRERLTQSLASYLEDKKGLMRLNDTVNNQIVIQVFDYMEIEKRPLSLFAMWAKYILLIDYGKDNCAVEIRNVVLVEPSKKDTNVPDTSNDFAFSAEDVFLRNKYKLGFVKHASNKIAGYLIDEIEELYSELEDGLK